MAEAGLTIFDRYEDVARGHVRTIDPDLQRDRVERALAYRPNWTEGHLRLAEVLLRSYSRDAEALLREAVPDPLRRAEIASPLWLHRRWHDQPEGSRESAESLLADEPIRRYLAPALRAFLNARRTSPVVALPHAGIASLDFLLEHGDPSPTYLARAERLAGSKRRLLESIAELAAVEDDLPLAARCWRAVLLTEGSDWTAVADASAAALPPDLVLGAVVPDGPHALLFAERLYRSPDDREIRDIFVRDALDRLEHDSRLAHPARLEIEARAWNILGDRGRARERLTEALRLDPGHDAWRNELVGWLIAWGRPDDAHRLALIGVSLSPASPEMRVTLERAVAALAEQAGER
jgi:hypothetical protein